MIMEPGKMSKKKKYFLTAKQQRNKEFSLVSLELDIVIKVALHQRKQIT